MITDVDRYIYKDSEMPYLCIKFGMFEHLSGAQKAQQITKKDIFDSFFYFSTPWSELGSDWKILKPPVTWLHVYVCPCYIWWRCN